MLDLANREKPNVRVNLNGIKRQRVLVSVQVIIFLLLNAAIVNADHLSSHLHTLSPISLRKSM